ncbi:MAG: acyl-CoA-binding protein [bacterium]|nr:acyl-CoA-binding protein [bacterium]
MTTQEQLEAAAAKVKTLSERPSNEVLLNLYALYKQASEGDLNIEKPAMFDFVAMAKYNAWNGIKGLNKEEATQKYIDLVNSLF